jgi:hypothetical protein
MTSSATSGSVGAVVGIVAFIAFAIVGLDVPTLYMRSKIHQAPHFQSLHQFLKAGLKGDAPYRIALSDYADVKDWRYACMIYPRGEPFSRRSDLTDPRGLADVASLWHERGDYWTLVFLDEERVAIAAVPVARLGGIVGGLGGIDPGLPGPCFGRQAANLVVERHHSGQGWRIVY